MTEDQKGALACIGFGIFSLSLLIGGCLGNTLTVRECRGRARDAYEACQTAKTQGCADRYVADLALCDPG